MISIAAARTTALGALINSPLFAWENRAAAATLGGTTTLAGGPASNAVNGNTHSFWLPDISGTTAAFNVQFSAARTVSFVAIVAHNVATLSASVQVRRSTNGGANWSDAGAGTVTPTTDAPIAFRMVTTGADAADWQLYFTGLTASDPLAVGVAFFGDDLVMPQSFYQGFAPILTPTEVELQSNVSIGGNYLGSSVIKRGSSLQCAFEHIEPTFFRAASWLSFQRHFNEGRPAFCAWRPAKYASDLHYLWRDGPTLRPTNDGPRDLMAVQMQARVYEG
jgi:hypothetical protein